MEEKHSVADSCEPDPLTPYNERTQNYSPRKLSFESLFSVTFFLTAATALLYVFGYIFQTSYLHTWGVETDLFILPIQQYLVYGSSVLSAIGMSGGQIWLIIAGGLLVFAYLLKHFVGLLRVPGVFKFFWKCSRSKSNRETNDNSWFKSRVIDLLLNFLISLIIVLLSYSFYNLTKLVSRTGESAAKNMMKTLTDENFEYSVNGFSKIKTFETEHKSFNAFVIAANDKFHALYIPSHGNMSHHILTIPTGSILSVTAEGK
jgi:hypothetical protein